MEPDGIDLEAGAKALAILSFIPVVIFALWSEYFGRSIDQLLIKNPQFEREPELEKVRLISLCVILFQLTLFLGSSEIRHAYPAVTEVVFALSIIFQLWVQARTEKKVQPASSNPIQPSDDLAGLALRAAVSWTLGAALYIFILVLSIKGASWAADKIHASQKVGTTLLLFGGAIGVVVGLGLNFALSPLHLRKLLPTHPLRDPQLLSDLEACFAKAGLKPPLFLIIELEKIQFGTALLAGFQNGRGPLRQAMFLSRPALKNLSLLEVKAIVLNQVSHIILRHFRKRFVFSFLLIVMTTALSVLSVVITEEFLTAQAALEVIGPGVALLSFFVSFRFLSNQNKKQELEADLYSIEKLGVKLEDFSSALRKLDPPSLPDSSASNISHLETERRIQSLTEYFGRTKISDQDNDTQAKAS